MVSVSVEVTPFVAWRSRILVLIFLFTCLRSVFIAHFLSFKSNVTGWFRICVTIERFLQECFYEKDYMNHRYHAKRCLYLCVIEKHLLSSSSIEKVVWSTLQNEARKPVLVVFPGVF